MKTKKKTKIVVPPKPDLVSWIDGKHRGISVYIASDRRSLVMQHSTIVNGVIQYNRTAQCLESLYRNRYWRHQVATAMIQLRKSTRRTLICQQPHERTAQPS